ncbi:thioredoxin family protein [Streptomyces sp. NPDC002644]
MTSDLNPVLIGADWCQPCKKTKPHFEAVCDEYGLYAEYVEVEHGDSRSYDVTSVPVIRIFDEDYDEILAEHKGGANAAIIRRLIEEAKSKLGE